MASPIRMTGINSGLDTESIVTALTSGYKSKVDKYKQQQTKVSWKQDAWKGINKKVYSLYTSLDSMRFSANWKLQKATSSNTNKATVTSNGKAFTGTQSLRIASVATSASITGSKVDDSITGSTTMADLGYTEGGEAAITANGKSFTVDSSTTVSAFVSKLQSTGVNASFDTSSHRMFVSAKKSGVDGDFSIEGDSDGVKILNKLGLLTNEKSTMANTAYASIIGFDGLTYDEANDTLVYKDNDGSYSLNSTSKNDRDKVVAALTANINTKVSEYNTAKAAKGAYNSYAKEIETGLSYVRTFKSYNDTLQKYGIGDTDDKKNKSIDDLDSTIEELASLKDGSIMVLNSDNKYDEYTLEDSKNSVYKHGDQYFKKNDDGSLTEVTGNADDGWTAKENSTIEAGKVKTMGDYRMSSKATDQIAQALYQKNYSELGDNEQKAVASATISLISQRASLDDYENATDATTIGDAVAGTNTDNTKVNWTRKDIANLVKGIESDKDTYTASSYDPTRITLAIGKLNQADQYWKSQESTQDTIIENDSLVSSIAGYADGQTGADKTKYDKAVSDLADAAKTAFINQNVTNANISGGTAKKIAGTDAKIYLNGQEYTQSSNNFTINGLTINVTGKTENADSEDGETINITTRVDTQGIYDKIKNFFSTYNDVINELTDSFNAESSKGYDPLTDDQKSQMSDTEVEKWEKKAKAGLLRNDSTLSSIMNSITNTMLGSYTINGKKYSLANFGIMTKGILNAATNRQYEYHIDGDEDDESVSSNQDKLMAAINEDPDSVIEFMQKLTNDLYQNLDKKMKRTSLKTAYTVYNDKEMASEYSSYTSLIKQWEDRLSTMEESYYQKFSKMESTLSKLQSSTSSLTNSLS